MLNRFTGNVQFTAGIECSQNDSKAAKKGLSVKWAVKNNANLRGADLRYANLVDAPIIENIHQRIYEAASVENALDMDKWHGSGGICGTTHCRAGWVVYLAGEEGKKLEEKMGTAAAAIAIYAVSDPEYFGREGLPNFYASNETALADMKRLAELEAKVNGETL